MLVYVAVLRDVTLSVDEVLGVASTIDKLEYIVNDYFGINPNENYTNPGTYLGYTRIEYSEHEDDTEGYYEYEDDNQKYKVYRICKSLDSI